MLEEAPLSIDSIVAAEKGRIAHPIVDVLSAHESQISDLIRQWGQAPTVQIEGEQILAANMGFLADAIEGIGDFPLQGLDMLAIWSKARDIMPDQPRYRLATMITAAHSLKGVDRLAKLKLQGADSVKIRKVPVEDIPKIKKWGFDIT